MPEKTFVKLPKLNRGDRVAILSPSFAAPGQWPAVYELGLRRLRDVFELDYVEYPTTAQVGSSPQDRARDLIAAFENPDIKGIITSLGGDDRVLYAKNLPTEPFVNNPKPYFGYSDNTHIQNHLWLCGIPSFYGGALFTQFALQGRMDDLTVDYLRHALFDVGDFKLRASDRYSDIGLDWNDPDNLARRRTYEPNTGWLWDGDVNAEGVSWGGCLESIDEILRHGVPIPALEDFNNIVLISETSEEIPSAEYVHRVYWAFGERGILKRVQGVLVGRAKAWEFNKPQSAKHKQEYRQSQAAIIVQTVRRYNAIAPVAQNLDFGHTEPQICLPYGRRISINSTHKTISAHF